MSEPKRTLDWDTVWEQIDSLFMEQFGHEYGVGTEPIYPVKARIEDIIEAQLRQQNAA